jgi:Asp-tRNA(Asn)/Glu-tRNA(Gln) amidotransferase C subunit
MQNSLSLRDLIYFDFEKAASIFSQVEGGLLQETQTEVESNQDKSKTHKFDLKLWKPEFGNMSTEKKSQIESRILHHDLLIRIEEKLDELGVLVDINNELNDSDLNAELIRLKLEGASYVRAEGWAAIEDYKQINKFMEKFNDISDYVEKCRIINTKEFKETQVQLKTAKSEIRNEKDKIAKSKVRTLEENLKKLEQIKLRAATPP